MSKKREDRNLIDDNTGLLNLKELSREEKDISSSPYNYDDKDIHEGIEKKRKLKKKKTKKLSSTKCHLSNQEENLTNADSKITSGSDVASSRNLDKNESVQIRQSKGHYNGIIVNVLIILLGVSFGMVGFSVFYSYQQNKENQVLIEDGTTLYNNGSYSRSADYFERAKNKGIEIDVVHLYLARIYTIKRDYSKAIEYYRLVPPEKLIDEDTSKLGEAYFNQKMYKELIELWEPEIKFLDPLSIFILAESYYLVDELDQYYKTLELIKDFSEPAKILSLKDFTFDQFNLTDLNNLEPLPQLENYPLINDKYIWKAFDDKIKLSLEESRNGNKDYANLIKISAFKEIQQCKFLFSELEVLSTSLSEAGFPTSEVNFFQGGCYNQINQPDKAIEFLDKAINQEPANSSFRLELAYSYFLKEDIDKLDYTFKELSQIENSQNKEYILVGYYYDLEEYERVLDLVDELKNSDIKFEENIQNYLAYQELRVRLLYKGDTNICSEQDLISQLSKYDPDSIYDIYEQYMILGHCDVITAGEARNFGIGLLDEYFVNLASKNKQGVITVLDRTNFGGILTKYYREIGQKLI